MTTATQTMQIRKLSPHIGAEITGVDLRQVDTDTARQLNQAILDHTCMVIRDQHLTPEEFARAAALFGEVMDQDHPKFSFPGLPTIQRYSNFNVDAGGKHIRSANRWHSDGSFRERPPSYTILYAVEIPSTGGNTDVLNMRAGFRSLPDDLRKKVETMRTVNVRAASKSRAAQNPDNIRIMAQGGQTPHIHPLVRNIDGTGEKSLWFDTVRVENIEGMDPEASQDFLFDLLDKAVRPEFIDSHQWRLHDIFMWDNRSTFHRANYDYDMTQHRLMYHAMILGERPH